MSIYQLQREQVRDKILQISIDIFRDKGYDNATIDEITKLVGIAKGTFYNFYSSKNEILLTWAERRFETIPFKEAFDPQKRTEDNLFRLVDIIVEAIKEDPMLFRSFLMEIIRNQGNRKQEEQFDFLKIFKFIFQISSDSADITSSLSEEKLDVLNHSMFMGIMDWFDRKASPEGLDIYLKNVVLICMNGIKTNFRTGIT